MMIEISAAIDRDGLQIDEILESVRKLARLRHSRAADQHRDDRDLPLERRLDLHSDRIRLVVYSAAGTLGPAEPSWPDHDEQSVGSTQRVGDLSTKIDSRPDIVDIPEDRALSVA